MAKKTKQTSRIANKNSQSYQAKDMACQTCNTPCPCANCPKKVLIVGGIERMEPLYRQLIEANGHEFEYHAGHLRKGGNKLENLLQRADMILCPVNCNSHAACLQVKSLCKKHKKSLHIMKNFSLSAIERTLVEHLPA